MTDHWTLRPGTGLGRLTFGMSPEEVDAYADVYGPVEARMADRPPTPCCTRRWHSSATD